MHALPIEELSVTQIMSETDPTKKQQELLLLERFLRCELRRFQLSDRQRIIAEVINELPFGWGRESVRVPKLEYFTDLTGIARPHIHGALRALHDMRILKIEIKDNLPEYRLLPDSHTWQVRFRISRERIKAARESLREINHLASHHPAVQAAMEHLEMKTTGAAGEFPEDGLNFKDRQDAPFLAALVTDSVQVTSGVHQVFPELD